MKELAPVSLPGTSQGFAGRMLPQLRRCNFFVFMLLGPMLANAEFVSATITGNGLGPQLNKGDTEKGAVLVDGLVGGLLNSSASALVSANYGLIRLLGSVNFDAEVQATGYFEDTITFHSAALPIGADAMVTFSAGMSGTLTDHGLGTTSGWSLGAEIGIPTQFHTYQINRAGANFGNSQGYIGDLFGTYLATVPIKIGVAEPLAVNAFGSANATPSSDLDSESAGFDLSHTGFWGGIQSVTVNGVPVDFTVTSRSGTDYTHSFETHSEVPEPSGSWLLAAGIPLAWWMRRRFERRSHKRDPLAAIGPDAT